MLTDPHCPIVRCAARSAWLITAKDAGFARSAPLHSYVYAHTAGLRVSPVKVAGDRDRHTRRVFARSGSQNRSVIGGKRVNPTMRNSPGVAGSALGHAHYYGAFVLDPDGHRLEAVCHGPKK